MSLLARPVRIFLIGSEFFRTPGGIQRVNCLLVEMLAEFSASTPTEVDIFSFADEARREPGAITRVAGFRWHAFDQSRRAMATQLVCRLRESRPDLLLFTHAGLLRLMGLARLLRPQTKVAVLGHGVEVWKRLPASIRGWLRKADAVIVPSAFTRDKMAEANGVPLARMTVLAHGLDTEWAARGLAVGPRNGLKLLSVTRLGNADTYKGVDVVLRALPAMLRQHSAASYVVAGDGADRPRLEKLARELKVQHHVEFCGEVDRSRLQTLYSEADLFVLPSQKEGFGIVFLEAMSYGLPVVAARAGGAPDVVQDGVTGVLVAPGEPELLAGVLNGLLADAARRRALGDAGRRSVEESFLFEHFSRRWQRSLVELMPELIYLARQSAAFHSAVTISARPEENAA